MRRLDLLDFFRNMIVPGRPILVVLVLVASTASLSCRRSTPAPEPERAEVVPVPEPAPPGPSVALTASQGTIDAGNTVTLRWESRNASTVQIEPSIGQVAVSGSRPIVPDSSVTYTATATGPGGNATSSVRITVNAPPASASSESPTPSVGDLFGTNMQPVYFDFDRAEIRPDQVDRLHAAARFLGQHPDVEFTIEGHADERGSQEYNLGLGDRRANAVRQFLVSQGVATTRVETVSYGEERPVCTRNDDNCWDLNRRAMYTLREPGEAGSALK